MSTSCHDCTIEEKSHVCCGRHPLTGKRVRLVCDNGTSYLACPELEGNGSCGIYRDRPAPCREFFCDRFDIGLKAFTYRVRSGI